MTSLLTLTCFAMVAYLVTVTSLVSETSLAIVTILVTVASLVTMTRLVTLTSRVTVTELQLGPLPVLPRIGLALHSHLPNVEQMYPPYGV